MKFTCEILYKKLLFDKNLFENYIYYIFTSSIYCHFAEWSMFILHVYYSPWDKELWQKILKNIQIWTLFKSKPKILDFFTKYNIGCCSYQI